jgi:menaquinone-9 beta-reductase
MIPLHTCDALIAGGGPAGSMLAIALAEAGRDVVLIEKTRAAHHKVCGEFLSPESVPFLRRAGINPEVLGAQTIHSVRMAARDVLAEVKLPAAALSLTRRVLDEAMLQQAEHAGARVVRGWCVDFLSRAVDCKGMWRAQGARGDPHPSCIEGRNAFLATGKHDLRGWPRCAKHVQGSLVAMKMYFRLSEAQQAEVAGHVEILVYPGGYAGLQPVEGGWANLCALITRDKLRSLGGKWDPLLDHMQRHSSHLARRLTGAEPVLDRPLTLSSIPYGYCAPDRVDASSPWRLGDQTAVIPSFCGDGMAIALYTANRAAELYLDGQSAADFQEEVRRRLEWRLHASTMLSRVVIAAPSIVRAAKLWPSALSGIFSATRVPSGSECAVRSY